VVNSEDSQANKMFTTSTSIQLKMLLSRLLHKLDLKRRLYTARKNFLGRAFVKVLSIVQMYIPTTPHAEGAIHKKTDKMLSMLHNVEIGAKRLFSINFKIKYIF
jgi:hypothetical protein